MRVRNFMIQLFHFTLLWRSSLFLSHHLFDHSIIETPFRHTILQQRSWSRLSLWNTRAISIHTKLINSFPDKPNQSKVSLFFSVSLGGWENNFSERVISWKLILLISEIAIKVLAITVIRFGWVQTLNKLFSIENRFERKIK